MTERFERFLDAAFGTAAPPQASRNVELESANAAEITRGGRRYIQLASNNYLGLTTHPQVKEAVKRAAEQFGSGAGAARRTGANYALYRECEARIASLLRTEAALLMQSGFDANVGTLTALMGDGDLIVTDALNHASIIDGVRLSGADKRIYPHNDMSALEEALKAASAYRKCLVVTDGVFSMDGDTAKLPEIVALAQRYGAAVMVDDAHAIGVFGTRGGGTVEAFGVEAEVDIRIGTMSKAIGAVGGFVAGSERLIALMKQRARPFLFSTALPPAIVAGASAALDIISSEPGLREKLWENTRFFQQGLKTRGFNTGATNSPITPVILGETERAERMSAYLDEAGVFATPIAYPVVPRNSARIRAMVMATHTRDQLTQALDAFVVANERLSSGKA